MSRVARPASWRSISTSTARASSADVVTRQAGELGPCSAWASRSAATMVGAGRLVGDHRNLGGSGQDIDADPAVQLALGLGDVGVSRPDDHVGRRLVQQTEGHGGQGLHSAEGEDPSGAGDPRRVQHGGVRLSVPRRRRARQHVRHAGGSRHADGHEGAGQQRETAGGQVGTDRVDRHVLLPAHHPGNDLGLEVVQVLALHPGEPPGALRAGVERLAKVLRQFRGQRVDLLRRDLEVRAAAPAVQPLGMAATAARPSRSISVSISETVAITPGSDWAATSGRSGSLTPRVCR